jgi:protein translocase SecG subunit
MEILNLALTIVLFLTSLFLILLVLVQLPKKEAGLGTAFGGGTTDALFGAGAGNVLTQLTKYCTILFLVLCLVLSIMNKRDSDKTTAADTDKNKAKKEQPAQPGNGLGVTPSVPTPPIGPELPVNPTPSTNEPAPSTNEPAPSTNEPAPSTNESSPKEGEAKKN